MTEVTRRRSGAALAVLGALAVSACTSAPESRPVPSPTAAAPAAPVPASAAPASPAARPGFPSVPLAPADTVLVAPMSGTAAAHTPQFRVTEHKYTIQVVCVGGGQVTVTPQSTGEAVPCDGEARRVHVATDQKVASVAVTVSGHARWTVAVVLTQDFRTKTTKPVVAPTYVAA
jgi:hypothetical protein